MLDFVNHHQEKKSILINKVVKAVEMSDVNVAITQSENGIVLYPKGEKILDEELVNKTLSFLPKDSNEHFEKSLKFYRNKDFKDSAERLRQSIEEFLRYKLENKESFEKNIKILGEKLKNNETQNEIKNIIFKTFDYLSKCFNKHSKHGNNIDELENEFLIYQTGLLLRYINKSVSKEADKVIVKQKKN